jgi:hypothetical protein
MNPPHIVDANGDSTKLRRWAVRLRQARTFYFGMWLLLLSQAPAYPLPRDFFFNDDREKSANSISHFEK